MTRHIISARAWEVACLAIRDSGELFLSDFHVCRIATQVDIMVRAAARLHRVQESSCNGTISGERYERERARFIRSVESACDVLGELMPSTVWECEIGSGDPRGAAGLVRWAHRPQDGRAPEGWCRGDAWGGGGHCLPGAPARRES